MNLSSEHHSQQPPEKILVAADNPQIEEHLVNSVEDLATEELVESIQHFFSSLSEQLPFFLEKGMSIWLGAENIDEKTVTLTFYVVLKNKSLKADIIEELEAITEVFTKDVASHALNGLEVKLEFLTVSARLKHEQLKYTVQQVIENAGQTALSQFEVAKK